MSDEKKSFDVELCFRQSINVYRENPLLFIILSLTVTVVGTITFLILMGLLQAGFMMIILNYMRDKKKPQFDDLFKYFNRFGTLFLGFFIPLICGLLGSIFFVVPGLLIFSIWMYVLIFICDKEMNINNALKSSYNLVLETNIWKHLLLFIIILAILFIAVFSLGSFGIILFILTFPLTTGLIVSAYYQLAEKETQEVKEEIPK
jgi:uncharacterized membrane protein